MHDVIRNNRANIVQMENNSSSLLVSWWIYDAITSSRLNGSLLRLRNGCSSYYRLYAKIRESRPMLCMKYGFEVVYNMDQHIIFETISHLKYFTSLSIFIWKTGKALLHVNETSKFVLVPLACFYSVRLWQLLRYKTLSRWSHGN